VFAENLLQSDDPAPASVPLKSSVEARIDIEPELSYRELKQLLRAENAIGHVTTAVMASPVIQFIEDEFDDAAPELDMDAAKLHMDGWSSSDRQMVMDMPDKFMKRRKTLVESVPTESPAVSGQSPAFMMTIVAVLSVLVLVGIAVAVCVVMRFRRHGGRQQRMQ
jgi:hypothetical protein